MRSPVRELPQGSTRRNSKASQKIVPLHSFYFLLVSDIQSKTVQSESSRALSSGVRLGKGTHSDGTKPQDLLRFFLKNPKGVQLL